MPENKHTIGRYVIDRTLGQGAMGVVYLAEDPLLKRRVAIKVVRAVGQERAHALSRFQREAEISAQLNHPNIVTIFDVGDEPGVGPFLAMEFVEGNNLGFFIREGSLDLETRFSVLIQTMRALRAAHRHAIVHRDVKPENILVAETGRVKLMDFGIAKTMAPQTLNPEEFLGSPAYSAPELLRGSEPTPSSDRYSFAVTAFELLTGQLPHPGNTVAEVVTHVLMEPPVFPPGMSGDLAKAFRQALAQGPEERPGTLMEFLTALVDAHSLEGRAHERLNDLFRHDDYAGDIVPIRRTRAAAGAPPAFEGPGIRSSDGRSTGARSTGGRSTPTRPAPSYPLPPAVKIELEASPPPPRPPIQDRRPRQDPDGFLTPMKLVKWIIAILVLGPLCWWVVHFLQNAPGGTP
ncbi:MAG: serine/threonine-protein kinase [Holophaga sp.]|nr:serine/threonine-protein kinase [Holophaga sp.]